MRKLSLKTNLKTPYIYPDGIFSGCIAISDQYHHYLTMQSCNNLINTQMLLNFVLYKDFEILVLHNILEGKPDINRLHQKQIVISLNSLGTQ